MKKIILLTVLLGALMAGNAYGTYGYAYGGMDAVGGFWYLLDYNGVPLVDGDLSQCIWVGPNGVVDPPELAKGTAIPGGDDILNCEGPISWANLFLTFDVQPAQIGDVLYCRIFDEAQGLITTENYYGDSEPYTTVGLNGESYYCLFPGDPGAGHTDTPLPVELMSFDAIGRDGEVLLEWKTATETDCFGFHIERDGERITFIEGAGNSTTEQTYTYVDKGLTNGVTYYYSLITVDMDGVEMMANENPVAGTPTAHMPTLFALHQNYPNPFNPYTDIKYDVPKDVRVTLKVYNVLGAEVAMLVDADQKANFYTVRWDAKDMASGVYFCTLNAGDFKAVKKMVLLK
jgi:hypothetical protein